MDVIVAPSEDPAVWILEDLLGLSMGSIAEVAPGVFEITLAGEAPRTMADMKRGPYPSLDAVLSQIETHTRGVCRRVGPHGKEAS